MQPYSLPSDSTYLIAFTRLTAVVGELDIFLISFALALDFVIQVSVYVATITACVCWESYTTGAG